VGKISAKVPFPSSEAAIEADAITSSSGGGGSESVVLKSGGGGSDVQSAPAASPSVVDIDRLSDNAAVAQAPQSRQEPSVPEDEVQALVFANLPGPIQEGLVRLLWSQIAGDEGSGNSSDEGRRTMLDEDSETAQQQRIPATTSQKRHRPASDLASGISDASAARARALAAYACDASLLRDSVAAYLALPAQAASERILRDGIRVLEILMDRASAPQHAQPGVDSIAPPSCVKCNVSMMVRFYRVSVDLGDWCRVRQRISAMRFHGMFPL
jgi:hypothetical protein